MNRLIISYSRTRLWYNCSSLRWHPHGQIQAKNCSKGSTHLPPKCKQASMVKKRTGRQGPGILWLCSGTITKMLQTLSARKFIQLYPDPYITQKVQQCFSVPALFKTGLEVCYYREEWEIMFWVLVIVESRLRLAMYWRPSSAWAKIATTVVCAHHHHCELLCSHWQ